jgi:hypothetical protein
MPRGLRCQQKAGFRALEAGESKFASLDFASMLSRGIIQAEESVRCVLPGCHACQDRSHVSSGPLDAPGCQ